MKNVIIIVAVAIGAFLAINVVVWGITGSDLVFYKFFAPKYEEVRRNVFENTPSYKWGMVQDLQNMQFKYLQEKNPDVRAALASVIISRATQYGESRLPGDLAAFVNNLKAERRSY